MYLGISMLVWLAVGAIIGLKSVYLDKALSKENLEMLEKSLPNDPRYEMAFRLIQDKRVYIAICSFGGLFTLLGDLKSSFTKGGK